MFAKIIGQTEQVNDECDEQSNNCTSITIAFVWHLLIRDMNDL